MNKVIINIYIRQNETEIKSILDDPMEPPVIFEHKI